MARKRKAKKKKKLTTGQKAGVGVVAIAALGAGWWLWKKYRTGQAGENRQALEASLTNTAAPTPQSVSSGSRRRGTRGATPKSTPGCPPPTQILWPPKGADQPTKTSSGLVIDIPKAILLDERARGIYGTAGTTPPMIHLSTSKPTPTAIEFGKISSRAADLRPLIAEIERNQTQIMADMGGARAKQLIQGGISRVINYTDVGSTLASLPAAEILSKSVAEWQQDGSMRGKLFDPYELNDFLCQIKMEMEEGVQFGEG